MNEDDISSGDVDENGTLLAETTQADERRYRIAYALINFGIIGATKEGIALADELRRAFILSVSAESFIGWIQEYADAWPDSNELDAPFGRILIDEIVEVDGRGQAAITLGTGVTPRILWCSIIGNYECWEPDEAYTHLRNLPNAVPIMLYGLDEILRELSFPLREFIRFQLTTLSHSRDNPAIKVESFCDVICPSVIKEYADLLSSIVADYAPPKLLVTPQNDVLIDVGGERLDLAPAIQDKSTDSVLFPPGIPGRPPNRLYDEAYKTWQEKELDYEKVYNRWKDRYAKQVGVARFRRLSAKELRNRFNGAMDSRLKKESSQNQEETDT